MPLKSALFSTHIALHAAKNNSVEGRRMKIKTIITGISVCAAAGTAIYAISAATNAEKRMLKRRTSKAMHAIGEMAEGIAQIMG